MALSATSPCSISFFSSSLFSSSPLKTPSLFSSSKPHHVKPLRSLSQSPKLVIRSDLATLPILSFDGEKIGETFLDLKSAPAETARAVVHRGIITDQQNKRRVTASTLTRAEVRGGGIKPYPQKKTGRARRGSQRTPIRPGGGVIFGPKPKDWSIKINRKEKRLAISTALSSASVNTIVVEDFVDKFEKPKTKEFIAAMKRWGLDPKEKAMFWLDEVPDNVRLSSRNIGTLKLLTPRTLNLFDILNADKVDAKAVADGDTVTVYVNATDPREAPSVPKEVKNGMVQRAKARAVRDYVKADALHKNIVDAEYRVLNGPNNEEILGKKYRIRLRRVEAVSQALYPGWVELLLKERLRELEFDIK